MSTSYYQLFWAILLEAGFASMWQDEYPTKGRFARGAYLEAAGIMQARTDIRARRYHECNNYSRQSD